MKRVISKLLALIILTALCAGCGTASGNTPAAETTGAAGSSETAGAVEASGDKKEINLLAWAGIESEAIEKLQELSGYKINYTPFSTLEEMLSKCMSKSVQYDIAMSSDYIIEALCAQDGLEVIATDKIPNYSQIEERFLSPSYDPDNKWSVPYVGGQIGILINRDLVTTEIKSYADLWKPELANQIVVIDDQRMLLGITNLVNGFEFNTADEVEIKATKEKLAELLPNIKAFAYSQRTLMLSGEAGVAVGSSMDAYRAAEGLENWEYIYPSEGMHMFMDSYVIPKGADMDGAHAYINAVISMDYIYRKGEDTNLGMQYSNKNMLAKLEEAGGILQIGYPPESEYDKAHYMKNIGEASLIYDELWTELKQQAGSKAE